MPLLQLSGGVLSPLADPEPLPSAPFFEQHVLTSPVPTAILLVVVGALAWWFLQRSGKVKVAWMAAGGGVVAAGLVMLAAQLVTTEREKLVIAAESLVADTLAARAAAVAPVLRTDLTLRLLSRQSRSDRDRVLKIIEQDPVKTYQAQDSHLKWSTATLDGPNVGRTQCRVMVKGPWSDGLTPSTWMLYWTRPDANSPWQVRTIELQQLGLMPQNSLGDI